MIWLLACLPSVTALYLLSVIENMPLSTCTSGFKGLEVDIVRDSLILYGWHYNEDFLFQCSAKASTADALFGGVILTPESYNSGLLFSVPTLAGGLSIMVSQDIQDTFSTYLGVLGYSLWLTMAGVWVVFSFFIWLFERGNKSIPEPFLSGIVEASWIALIGLMLMNTHRIKRVSTRILLVFYWLFCYTNLALFLACNARNYLVGMSTIDSPESLQGRRVITSAEAIDSISRYAPLLLDFQITEANFDTGVAMLRNKQADAIVFDYDFMQGYSSDVCDLVIVSRQFASYYYIVQITKDQALDLQLALNVGLNQLRESTNLKPLEEQYLQASGVCNNSVYNLQPNTFANLTELWIVWVCGIILAFIVRAVLKRTQRINDQKYQEEEIRELMSRPETRILKHTEVFVHNMSQHLASIFSRMEKTVKKQNFLQQKFISTMRNLSVKLDNGYKLE